MPNMTLSIPEDLFEEMNKIPEVKWSEVARDAISKYIQIRKTPDLGPVIEKLSASKNQQYQLGYDFAKTIAQSHSYDDIEKFFSNYDRDVKQVLHHSVRDDKNNLVGLLIDDLLHYNFADKSNNSAKFKLGLYDGLMDIKKGLGL